ncbi:MAG: hypothetical protein NC131_16420 [Roseburia sp.]|nr:hypothetical protein [Roseburia sp.]
MDTSDWLKRLNHEDDTSLRNNWALQRIINTAKDVFTNRCDLSIWLTDIEQLSRQLSKEFIFHVVPHSGTNMDVAPRVKEFMSILKIDFDTTFKPRYKVPDKPAFELFSTTQKSDLYMPVSEVVCGSDNRLGLDICVPYDYYAVPEYIVFTTESSSELENLLHVCKTCSMEETCSFLPYEKLTV